MVTTSPRERLPNRRLVETFNLEAGGLTFTCSVGYFPNGRLGEVFLSNHKAGSTADVAARDCGIVASLALQCGADVETIRHALCRDPRGRAYGPLGVALDAVAGGAS